MMLGWWGPVYVPFCDQSLLLRGATNPPHSFISCVLLTPSAKQIILQLYDFIHNSPSSLARVLENI